MVSQMDLHPPVQCIYQHGLLVGRSRTRRLSALRACHCRRKSTPRLHPNPTWPDLGGVRLISDVNCKSLCHSVFCVPNIATYAISVVI